MSRMQVASFNDVKIYNLSAGEWCRISRFHENKLLRIDDTKWLPVTGKAVPQWLPERQRRNLAKDENYRRRVEIIQDLEFPTASQVGLLEHACTRSTTGGIVE